MSTENKLYTKHIVGYSDEISVRPGNNISFMVSSEDNAGTILCSSVLRIS